MTQPPQLGCACGKVLLQVRGVPIISAECCCNSCRAAGARLQTLPGARPVLSSLGATRFVLYRKDRVHFQQGTEHLNELRLTPEAKTRRVVATSATHPSSSSSRKATGSVSMARSGPKGRCPRSNCGP